MKNKIKNIIKNVINSFKRDDFKAENSGITYYVCFGACIVITLLLLIFMVCKNTMLSDLFIITIILSVIITVFLYNYYSMVDNYIKIKLQLINFSDCIQNIQDIDEFSEKYEDIKEQVYQIEHIADIWHEFCETLIPVRSDSETIRYKNTAQSELYLNKDSVIVQQANLSLYEAIPGILTGLGLVGTFLAITVALMNFNLVHLDKSVELLLGGLSVKFISSLAGIISSLFFIWIKEQLFGKLEVRLTSVQNKLNKIFPRRTTESFLNDILIEIKEQSDSIKEFLCNMDFQSAIKKAMSLGLENLKPEFINIRESINYSIDALNNSKQELFAKLDYLSSDLNNVLNNMNNNMANSLSNSISNSLNSLTADLSNAIRELNGVAIELKNTKQESSATIVENMIRELKECMGNMQNNFTSAILDNSGDTISNLQKSLANASSYLENSQQMYSSFMNTMQEQITRNNQERDSAVNNVVNQTMENLNDVNNMVNNSLNIQNDRIQDWMNNINNYIAEIHNNEMNVKNNYGELLTDLNNAIDRQKEIVNTNSQFVNILVNASNQLNGSTNNLMNAQNLITDNLNNSASVNNQFIERINELNNLNREINEGLNNNIKIIENHSNVYENINTNTSQLIETLTNNINDFANKSHEFQNNLFEEFGKNMSTQLYGLNAIVQQQKEIVEDLADTLEDVVNKGS